MTPSPKSSCGERKQITCFRQQSHRIVTGHQYRARTQDFLNRMVSDSEDLRTQQVFILVSRRHDENPFGELVVLDRDAELTPLR